VLIGPLNLDKCPIAKTIPTGFAIENPIENLGYNPGNLCIPMKNAAFEPTLDEHSGRWYVDFEVFHWASLLVILYYPIF